LEKYPLGQLAGGLPYGTCGSEGETRMCLLGMTVSTLQKKQKRGQAHEEDAGNMWDHTAVAADSKLVVSLVVGKRTQEQTHALVKDARGRRGCAGFA